jgi:hypothetical protein
LETELSEPALPPESSYVVHQENVLTASQLFNDWLDHDVITQRERVEWRNLLSEFLKGFLDIPLILFKKPACFMESSC